MNEVVIVGGCRTAVGSFGGSLKDVPAVELGAQVLRHTLKRLNLRPEPSPLMQVVAPDRLKENGPCEPETRYADWDASATPVAIDEVVMGHVLTSGLGQNPARQATIMAGIPKETPAFTINKVCGSGLKAIALGASAIMTGNADVVLAGGQENMSQAPLALKKARWGHRMELTGVGEIHDLMVFDGLFEIFYGYHMGMTAENIAKLHGISREDQDMLSFTSHSRALQAIRSGIFAEEIVPIQVKSRKEVRDFAVDERPMETSMEKLAKLRPAFDKNGSVTAGNASGINDGAAAVLLMSAQKAKELGLAPIAKVSMFDSGGIDPAYMGLGPIPAIRKVLHRSGLSIADIDMIELNEAFASQAIACMRELNIDLDKPNELGSGISLGHPIGCTGARQMVTAIHQMKRKGYASGIISMCIGGGMGMAMLIQR